MASTNTAIVKANTLHLYTNEQKKALIQASKDPYFFVENFCKVTFQGKTQKFIPFSYQRRLLDAIINNQYVVALWPRQSGKTEIAAAYMLWFAMFHSKMDILIAAHKFEHVAEIIKRIKQIYEDLPAWIKAGVTRDGYNARSIKFENHSTIQGVATTPSSGRGRTIDLLYVDEFAFVPPNMAKEFWAAIQPTLSSSNGKCIITSTPNNDDDEFAQIWHQALDITDDYGNTGDVGRNGFKAVPAKWDEHPYRNDEWKDKQYSLVGDERWRREFLCEFISFDETLINPIFINEELNKMGNEPIFKTGNVRWYKSIEPNKTYLVGLDPSMGTGYDPAAIQIFQLPELIQVGEWRHNKTPIPGQIRTLWQILKYISEEMSSSVMQREEPDIYWTVENNVIGEAALIALDDIGEENFPGVMLTETKKGGNGRRYRRGYNTTSKTKIEVCSRFKSLLEQKTLKINSKALIREIKFFVASGNSYKAKTGEHDDLIMCTLLILRMLQDLLEWDDELQATFKSTDIIDGYLDPMPTILL